MKKRNTKETSFFSPDNKIINRIKTIRVGQFQGSNHTRVKANKSKKRIKARVGKKIIAFRLIWLRLIELLFWDFLIRRADNITYHNSGLHLPEKKDGVKLSSERERPKNCFWRTVKDENVFSRRRNLHNKYWRDDYVCFHCGFAKTTKINVEETSSTYFITFWNTCCLFNCSCHREGGDVKHNVNKIQLFLLLR